MPLTWNQTTRAPQIALICALVVSLLALTANARTIRGVARNQTRGQWAVGDDVLLLVVDHDMREEARTKTDSQGGFGFEVNNSAAVYWVRIVHQGVSYDTPASTGQVMSIDVFDSAERVQGVTGNIEIIRAGTNGKLLHIADMVEIRNNSNPPMTQVGNRTFEVYLAAHAKIDSVLAAGPHAVPAKVAMMISAVPLPGESGHYAVSFPLRPGATKFAFNYDVPYDGHAAFQTRHLYPLQQLAVMIPPTMSFLSRSRQFTALATGYSDYQVQAASQVRAGAGPDFEVSGSGILPPLQNQAKSPVRPQSPVPSSTGSARGNSSVSSLTPANASTGQSRFPQSFAVLFLVASLLVGVCALATGRVAKMRGMAAQTMGARKPGRTQGSAILLEHLKEELFQLEGDKIRGSISENEYASARHALEETVKRVVARAG